eukprot:TRINITY_DN7881_c0_g1_i11.p1 TRINITY_DN7881_c0_g1~~TRINITY_DN7881_c0_g1_i11.p1  ORF type:complete len:409 (-),score=70.67 TRINITY_DN7881_c0_g1_i11:876-2102(-)
MPQLSKVISGTFENTRTSACRSLPTSYLSLSRESTAKRHTPPKCIELAKPLCASMASNFCVICSTFSKGMKAFQVDCINRANQSMSFVDSVEAEVVESLRRTVSEQQEYLKSYGGKFERMKEQMDAASTSVQRLRERYVASLSDAEKTLYDCESARVDAKIDSQTQDRFNARIWNSLASLKEARDRYKECEKLSAAMNSQCELTLAEVLTDLQNHEEQRTQIIKDSLQKLLVYEVSVEQNHRYDIQQITSAVQSMNPKDDIHRIAALEWPKNSTSQLMKLPQVELKTSKWDRLFEVYDRKYYGKKDSLDYDTLVKETRVHIMRSADEEYRGSYEVFRELGKRVLGECRDPDVAKAEVWKELLESAKGRFAFLDCLKENICMGNYKLTQMGYKVIGELILFLINKVIGV